MDRFVTEYLMWFFFTCWINIWLETTTSQREIKSKHFKNGVLNSRLAELETRWLRMTQDRCRRTDRESTISI